MNAGPETIQLLKANIGSELLDIGRVSGVLDLRSKAAASLTSLQVFKITFLRNFLLTVSSNWSPISTDRQIHCLCFILSVSIFKYFLFCKPFLDSFKCLNYLPAIPSKLNYFQCHNQQIIYSTFLKFGFCGILFSSTKRTLWEVGFVFHSLLNP